MRKMALFSDRSPLAVHGNVIIYGGGVNCAELLVKLKRSNQLKELNVECIIDRDRAKHGRKIFDIPIRPIETLLNCRADTPVIITPYEPSLEIGHFLENNGFRNLYYVSPHRADQALTRRIIEESYLSDRKYWDHIKSENAGVIETVRENLHDIESVKIYDAFIESRFKLDQKGLEKGLLSREYYPEDVIKMGSNEVFVDCGIFNGNSILDFISHCKEYEYIYGFEPDPMQYELSKTFIESLNIKNYELSDNALYGTSEKVEFFTTFGGGSGIIADETTFSKKFETENIIVHTETLDHFLSTRHHCPTYIKMDIEGAELEALKGAKATISKNSPKLAICVYHKPTDIWEIPYWIIKNFPQYTLYLRQHELYTDIVLYAVLK